MNIIIDTFSIFIPVGTILLLELTILTVLILLVVLEVITPESLLLVLDSFIYV